MGAGLTERVMSIKPLSDFNGNIDIYSIDISEKLKDIIVLILNVEEPGMMMMLPAYFFSLCQRLMATAIIQHGDGSTGGITQRTPLLTTKNGNPPHNRDRLLLLLLL